MATVDGLTKERMLAIEAESITNARIDPVTNHLILTTHGGTDIDTGNVQGPQGPAGPINPHGADLTLATLQAFAGPLSTPSIAANFTGTMGRYVGLTNGAPVYAGPVTGDFATDHTHGCLWLYNGTTWIQLGGNITPWTNIPLLPNWVTLGGFPTPRYRKDWTGEVYLDGVAVPNNGSTVASGATAIIGNLPANHRPLNQEPFVVMTLNAAGAAVSGVPGRVDILTSGVIQLVNGQAATSPANPWYALTGIHFPTN